MIAIPLLIWGVEMALPPLSAMVMPVIYGALTGAALYGGYKLGEVLNKDVEGYAPDRELPRDKHGNPIPDTDSPHTQLGIRDGTNGKYRQGREFDENGRPLRDEAQRDCLSSDLEDLILSTFLMNSIIKTHDLYKISAYVQMSGYGNKKIYITVS